MANNRLAALRQRLITLLDFRRVGKSLSPPGVCIICDRNIAESVESALAERMQPGRECPSVATHEESGIAVVVGVQEVCRNISDLPIP